MFRVRVRFPAFLSIFVITGLMSGLLTGCSSSVGVFKKKPKYSPRVVSLGQVVPKGGGVYKVGNPYQIAGRWYTPKEDRYYDKRGIASWYGEEFHGRKTANGEVFDMYALSAAHPTMPLPSYAEVTNIRNGRTIVVRVNDRGPYKHDREIDLSKKVAMVLGFYRNGTTPIRVRYLGRAPLNGDDRFEKDVLMRQSWYRQEFAAQIPDYRNERRQTAGYNQTRYGQKSYRETSYNQASYNQGRYDRSKYDRGW